MYQDVALGMGAWIEMSNTSICPYSLLSVAPGMGAWIEIRIGLAIRLKTWSLPVWERGLKSPFHAVNCQPLRVAPGMGAWIEIYYK